jgi:hypothetical protein
MLIAPLALIAALAVSGTAWAQAAGSADRAGPGREDMARPSAPDRLIGLPVRLRERDRIVGEVAEVVTRDGRSGLVVQVESQDHRPVLLDADAVEQEGGKLYLAISEAALRELPTFESASGGPGSTTLPFGGTAPGWGAPQGGLPHKKAQ